MNKSFLSALLDEYEISNPNNYFDWDVNKKDKFLKRLSVVAINDKKRVLPDLKKDQGLKMHFNVTHDMQNGWHNIPNDTFARKLAFFSGKTIITFPFHEVSYSNGKDLRALLNTLCIARPFLDKDMLNIFPSMDSDGLIKPHMFNDKYKLVSANFNDDRLETQFEETYEIARLLLPIFKNVNASDVVHIRETYQREYSSVEARLAKLLNDKATNEDKLLNEMRDIHIHVNDLTKKFCGLQKALRRRDICTVFGFATVTLISLFPPTPALAAVLEVIGAYKGFEGVWEILKERIEDSKSKREITDDEFFIFWRISNPSEKL